MSKLGKRLNRVSAKGLESKEGERRRLPSSSADTRSPSLEFNPNNELDAEKAAFEYLKAFCRNIIRNELQKYVHNKIRDGESI